jgi:hypothetical protein
MLEIQDLLLSPVTTLVPGHASARMPQLDGAGVDGRVYWGPQGLVLSAGTTADCWTVKIPPPMMMEPGLPPGRSTKLEGIGTAGPFTFVANVRAYPKAATFTMLGKKTYTKPLI